MKIKLKRENIGQSHKSVTILKEENTVYVSGTYVVDIIPSFSSAPSWEQNSPHLLIDLLYRISYGLGHDRIARSERIRIHSPELWVVDPNPV